MGTKVFCCAIAGFINGKYFEAGDPVEMKLEDAKPLVEMGTLASDEDVAEGITIEEYEAMLKAFSEAQDCLIAEKRDLESKLSQATDEILELKKLIDELKAKLIETEVKPEEPAQTDKKKKAKAE